MIYYLTIFTGTECSIFNICWTVKSSYYNWTTQGTYARCSNTDPADVLELNQNNNVQKSFCVSVNGANSKDRAFEAITCGL